MCRAYEIDGIALGIVPYPFGRLCLACTPRSISVDAYRKKVDRPQRGRDNRPKPSLLDDSTVEIATGFRSYNGY